MNVEKTNEYFKKNKIIALRADKGDKKTGKQVNQLLMDLGNPTRAIPYYALYPADGGEPVLLDGLISADQVIKVFEDFKSKSSSEMTNSDGDTADKQVATNK